MVNISHISFSYGEKNIIDNLSYSFQRDGFYVILGRSGEGKTTFLSLLQGVLTPNKGRVEIEDEVITQVFQSPLLIDYLNVKENILLPLSFQGKKEKEEEESVKEALSRVNLSGFEERMPKTLSGGESMRVSIARALVQKSTVLLLDEPTGQLDETNSKEIYTLLKELSKEMILIVVTHDEKTITPYGDAILELKNGKLFQKKVNKISRLHQKKPKEENKGCLSFSTALSLQNKFLKRRKARYFLSALFLAIDLLFFYFSFALKTDAKPFLETILETRYGYHTVKIQKREEVATSGHLTLKKEKIPTSSELALVGISNSYYSLEYFL
ncbi:MAG: ATP-binding cassette domain-containing protein, partial [Bacilli bacterium]|nr:ATP-binding cassette domain-containing protein [Bacilli bacterium]